MLQHSFGPSIMTETCITTFVQVALGINAHLLLLLSAVSSFCVDLMYRYVCGE